jgi:hypothetical protein
MIITVGLIIPLSGINWYVFVIDMRRIFCEVGIEFGITGFF